MAKPTIQKIKLLSSAGTGFFYVTKKHRDRQDQLPQIRSDCAQARGFQGNQDQVTAVYPNCASPAQDPGRPALLAGWLRERRRPGDLCG
jgi:hypothetical protein